MNTFKKLNNQDAYITTYTAQKHWGISGSQYGEYGIKKLVGQSGTGPYYKPFRDFQEGQYRRLVYDSIKQLYYTSYVDGTVQQSTAFDNYEQSSFNFSGSKYLGDILTVFSIPRDLIGSHIEPGSFSLIVSGSSLNDYMSSSYSAENGYDDFVETFSTLLTIYGTAGVDGEKPYIQVEPDYVEETPAAGGEYLFSIYPTPQIVDDKEGNLYLKGREPRKYVGNIKYTHGVIIITDTVIAEYFNGYFNANLDWKSNHTIYTHNYHCRVKESEYNISTNPTVVKNAVKTGYYNDGEIYSENIITTNGELQDITKIPEFQPYITTVGLYNDANELVAVAKMGQPVPKPANTEMTIVVKLDI